MIPIEIIQSYFKINYPMSSGSDEWINLKEEYEIESDALGAIISNESPVQKFGIEKVKSWYDLLKQFYKKVIQYDPKDETELKEKKLLSDKIAIAIKIYELTLQSNL
jgi:hypothetical protein